jgi:hypothetical protein
MTLLTEISPAKDSKPTRDKASPRDADPRLENVHPSLQAKLVDRELSSLVNDAIDTLLPSKQAPATELTEPNPTEAKTESFDREQNKERLE